MNIQDLLLVIECRMIETAREVVQAEDRIVYEERNGFRPNEKWHENLAVLRGQVAAYRSILAAARSADLFPGEREMLLGVIGNPAPRELTLSLRRVLNVNDPPSMKDHCLYERTGRTRRASDDLDILEKIARQRSGSQENKD